MDEKTNTYKPSEFLENNRKFLKGCCFKFEGLSPECEKGFTYVIKDLGGNVSSSAKYTLVEKLYVEDDESKKKRKDLYLINFIYESLNCGKLLDIESYRCDRTYNKHSRENIENSDGESKSTDSSGDSDPISKHIKREAPTSTDNSSNETDGETVINKRKNEQSDLSRQESISSRNKTKVNIKREYRSSSRDNTNDETDGETVISKRKNKQSDLSHQESISSQNRIKVNIKRVYRLTSTDNSSDESDSESLISKRKKKEYDLSRQQNVVSPNRKKVIKKRETNSSRDNSTNNETDTDAELTITKRRKKESDLVQQKNVVSQSKTNSKATERTWVDTKNFKSNRDNKENNNKKERNSPSNSGVEWTKSKVEQREDLKWLFELQEDDLCRIKNCKYEPGRHESHQFPGRIISEEEKLIILRYLIKNNLIPYAKGIRTWENMTNDGYLVHRSPETLRNCLRRTILPSICKYNLPVDIMEQFLELDEKRNKGKKFWNKVK